MKNVPNPAGDPHGVACRVPRGLTHLDDQTSPYLLQHRNNPVAWFPWGERAFEEARRRDVPIFLSIGYSTCYWCHVMERDSFENQEVATLLNRDFVSVKVDREERPDVDQLYMEAIVGMTGHGGWPMSVFLTPTLHPFWGGTFFYRDRFISILRQVASAWREERAQIDRTASRISEILFARPEVAGSDADGEKVCLAAVAALRRCYDSEFGGFGSEPKFPPVHQLRFLLRMALAENPSPTAVVPLITTTLDAMACGGIHDHVGGGFHRYATDRAWLVPHFEKMLYDNALLAITYLEGWQLTGHSRYAAIARRTLDFMLRELRDEEGGFVCALDAGEVGREGEYYVWNKESLAEVLSAKELTLLADRFGLSGPPLLDSQWHIIHAGDAGVWDDTERPSVEPVLHRLKEIRDTRIPPRRDDKMLCGWSALAIEACAVAARVLGDPQYAAAAVQAMETLERRLGRPIRRSWAGGRAQIEPTLEDYAYLIAALRELWQVDVQDRWLVWARDLQEEQNHRLWNEEWGRYRFSDAPELIAQMDEVSDNALPSPQAVSYLNLRVLAHLFGNSDYARRAERMAEGILPYCIQTPTAHPTFLRALREDGLERVTLLVVASDAEREEVHSQIQSLRHQFLPTRMVIARLEEGNDGAESAVPLLQGRNPKNGAITYYVCRESSCEMPTASFVTATRSCGFQDELLA